MKRGGVRHAVSRESTDFTLKVNRAERVQIVNRSPRGRAGCYFAAAVVRL
jgi:hypothetical protein